MRGNLTKALFLCLFLSICSIKDAYARAGVDSSGFVIKLGKETGSPSLQDLDSGNVDLNDLLIDSSDLDVLSPEDMDDYYLQGIRDFDDEILAGLASQSGQVLVLYTSKDTPEENQVYETFFKKLAPYLNSESLDLEIIMGKMATDEYPKLPQYFRPSSYPSFVLYDYARKFIYEDELEVVEFFTWFNQIISREVIELTDKEGLKQFIESDTNPRLVAFYSARSSADLEVLHELIARNTLLALDIRRIALCLEGCQAEYNDHTFSRPSLALFRNYQGLKPFAVLDTNLDQVEQVQAFCIREALPPVLVYDELNLTKMFGEAVPNQLIFLLDPAADNSKSLDAFQESAFYNIEHDPKSERISHIIYYVNETEDGLKWFFNVKDTKGLPQLFLTETSNEMDKIIKYQFQKELPLTLNALREFLSGFHNKKLERFFISEEVPDNQGKLINRLVGSTFKTEVIDSSDNYLVFMCPEIEEEEDCQKGLEVFTATAEHLHHFSNLREVRLKFGIIDVAKNEVDKENEEDFPQILLYRTDRKLEPTTFTGALTEEELNTWIKEWIPEIKINSNKVGGEDGSSHIKDDDDLGYKGISTDL